jgi:hypothetical protein
MKTFTNGCLNYEHPICYTPSIFKVSIDVVNYGWGN